MNNTIKIDKFAEIETSLGPNGWTSLILGNGASMALSTDFSYKSLYEYASTKGTRRNAITPIFQALDTTNFEHVLRVLSDIKKLAPHFTIPASPIDTAPASVRNALIEAVNFNHIKPIDLLLTQGTWTTRKDHICTFANRFQKVVTFCYDLTLYWALIDESQTFKDGFGTGGTFNPTSPSWGSEYKSTPQKLYFYPHGSLAIVAANGSSTEEKLAKTAGQDLRTVIQNSWSSGRDPLFVSEGTSAEKLATIRQSPYLNTVYNKVLTKLGPNVVAYGFSFAENDTHVLDAMATNPPSTLAISVYSQQSEDEKLAFIGKTSGHIRTTLSHTKTSLRFFHHDDPGVWIF